MKRLAWALLALCLLLSGCGRSAAEERYEPFSQALRERHDLCLSAEIRAEYPDRSVQFLLRYEDDPPGCRVTAEEPAEIRGVTAHLNGAQSALGYDSVTLDTGPLDRFGLSPVTALPRLVEALREGHLDSAWEEDGMTVWSLVPDDGLTVQIWLDDGMIPRRAELISQGRVAVFCEIREWK